MKRQTSRIKAVVTGAELQKRIGEQSFYAATLADGRKGLLIATELYFDVTLALVVGDRMHAHGEIQLTPEMRQVIVHPAWLDFDKGSIDMGDVSNLAG